MILIQLLEKGCMADILVVPRQKKIFSIYHKILGNTYVFIFYYLYPSCQIRQGVGRSICNTIKLGKGIKSSCLIQRCQKRKNCNTIEFCPGVSVKPVLITSVLNKALYTSYIKITLPLCLLHKIIEVVK